MGHDFYIYLILLCVISAVAGYYMGHCDGQLKQCKKAQKAMKNKIDGQDTMLFEYANGGLPDPDALDLYPMYYRGDLNFNLAESLRFFPRFEQSVTPVRPKDSWNRQWCDIPNDELQSMLKSCIALEHYELADIIKKELDQRKTSTK